VTELLDRLELDFDDERAEGYGLDRELEGQVIGLARPTVILTPRKIDGAPVAVRFSTFPGVHVRVGRWCTRAFPGCGCDACDETIEEEAERLRWLIENVTEGRFREAIWIPNFGSARRRAKLWSPDGRPKAASPRSIPMKLRS
jgi:hypothetical protein